ncbi:hypothetical protein Tco_0860896 [Tanacetum coccineum]|uniref:Uncharacterized protein n=1 Tax=Tanacetum coccineum TaxID=301880 RepID=A0ABQ5BLY0_9ASTR
MTYTSLRDSFALEETSMILLANERVCAKVRMCNGYAREGIKDNHLSLLGPKIIMFCLFARSLVPLIESFGFSEALGSVLCRLRCVLANSLTVDTSTLREKQIDDGLPIIKNSDFEEIRELADGTFRTVYHGKWKVTDVAIK